MTACEILANKYLVVECFSIVYRRESDLIFETLLVLFTPCGTMQFGAYTFALAERWLVENIRLKTLLLRNCNFSK